MSGETNRLTDLAHQIMDYPTPREMDVLLSTGEQVTIALLSMALEKRGVSARSFTGNQVQIRTCETYTKARIREIDGTRISAQLQQGNVVVVAGFQGVDEHGNITTLGRGGSDTTAVALAAALNADECQIYTDVKGVYTTDPRVVEDAKLLDSITFEEMLELASLGAKVLQIRAVEFAGKYKVDVIVQNAAADGNNDITFTVKRSDSERAKKILDDLSPSLKAESVSLDKKIGKVSVVGVGMKSHAGIASKMFKALADENINIQIITTSEIKISIVIDEKYLELAVRALHSAFDLGDPDYERKSID